jgi:tripartite ATP-independent transporter DctP family solute receptor
MELTMGKDKSSRMSRRAVVQAAGAMLAAPFVTGKARAAQINWRLGHVAPPNTPLHKRLLEAADAIAKRSDGLMELTVIGEGRAGIQSGLLAQVRGGGMEMTVASGAQLAPILPSCAIPLIGFLFSNYPSLWQAMDGNLGQMIRARTPTQSPILVLDKIWDFGFREITTSTRPIQTAADLAGLKIRTQIDPDEMDLFRALGASPVVITLPYLRMALGPHQVDGQEGLLAVAEYARLNEVQSYCAMTRHIWDGLWLCVNASAWKNLPDHLRNIVANTLNGAAQRQREDSAKLEDSIRATLSSSGMKFSDPDPDSFRDLLRRQGYYAAIKAKLGDETWDVVRKATGVSA